jgi:hypothetical protein
MSSRSKKFAIATLAVVGVYALTPLVAGLLKTYDRRGPKIFAEAHHEILYRFGYCVAGHHHHDGKPRVPYMQERSWFYGVAGERIDDRAIRQKLEALSQQR